ncbi:uncharacterized protein YndB with AHSA1/START domain [Diaminobutyricimonas aerilata]|uniref:Uncharacterized protein YndB with AHSA1/START domain n=1 Tax=Diaminobutyricimonas aerilata TaxID=1162967 RepID=A0A2M9CML5_9MICO|nr:SRPBCC family protein [Diaminobutyricimonas aerilata]PJJ73125.1 uncharacterized protein YndB with AHSA1/START domain [Diaminobutyricimonas aerilata]
MGRGIYVEVLIAAPLERVWELTQDPESHPRWDLRFSRITPVADLESGGYRFRYERRMPGHTIVGTGTSIGERRRADGTRTSALRFDTDDRWSPLGEGRGYWRYVPTDDGIRFITGYDYRPAWGPLDLVVRPFVGWMTAWSFDRLRIWAERDEPPERWPLATALAFWRRDRPRAANCARRPPGRSALDDAPSTLGTLEAP